MPWQVKHRLFGIIQIALPTFIRILSALHEWSLRSDQHNMIRFNSVNFEIFLNFGNFKFLEISNFQKFLEIDSLSRLNSKIFWPKLIFIGANHGNFRVNSWIFVEYPPRLNSPNFRPKNGHFCWKNYENDINSVKTGIYEILEKF